MTTPISRLAKLVETQTGFVIREGSFDALESYARRSAETGSFRDLDAYVGFLDRHRESDEWRALLNKITIKESYFFRGRAQFDALGEVLIPELVRHRSKRELRVWSAGCAHGEEAATLAIVLNEHPLLEGWDWSVLASDVDRHALAEARAGLHSRRAVAQVPAEYLARYFQLRGDQFVLRSDLMERITFRHINLVEAEFDVEAASIDFIFLRNVLIYFRPVLQQQVVETAARALAEHGSVFLGPSESLLHLGSDLMARDLGSCFAYRHRSVKSESVPAVHPEGIPSGPREMPRVDGPGAREHRAGEPGLDQRIASVVALMEERTDGDGALELIDALRRDLPENPLIHTLEGIARERTGDLDAAIDAYRGALYLAPDFSGARFLLALALATVGREKRAVREFRTVLAGLGSHPAPSSNILSRIGLPTHSAMIERCHEFLEKIG